MNNHRGSQQLSEFVELTLPTLKSRNKIMNVLNLDIKELWYGPTSLAPTQERFAWVALPKEYQDKDIRSITLTFWGTEAIVCHPELRPAIYRFGEWSFLETLKIGTKVILKDGVPCYEEPRPTPTEQRDTFQKNHPHLVKHLQNVGNIKLDPFAAPQDVSPPEEDRAELPKAIHWQLAESPLYYRRGKIQPWDFITSQGMSFLEGNIVKYVTRYKHKGGAEDLKKARTYLDKLISEVTCVRNSDG